MQKFTRLALLSAGVLGALLAIALLAVNLYVQSKETQARIENELSQRLGTELKIRRISVTPWWGLKLTGITMPQVEASAPGDFLQADAFRLRVRLTSLFSRRLVIKEISLINPTVVWAQNADGKWRLPATLLTEADAETAAPPVVATAPGTAHSSVPRALSAVSATVSQKTAEAEPADFTPEVRRVALTNGNFRFLDERRKPIANFEGVRFRSNLRSATALRGSASIARTSLRGRFFLRDLKSPLTYDPSELDFSSITAEAAGGEVMGRFTMRPSEADSPFAVMVKFRALEADRLVTEARGPEGMVQGKLEGHLEATGQTADPNALNGAGEIHLRDGQVRRYSLLVALGQLLQIDELIQLKLDQAYVKYHITPGVVTIDELVLTSPNLRLSATGTIAFNGDLLLESKLAINERIRGQLFSVVRDNFQPSEVAGYSAVSFQVNGSLEHPRTNLMDKVVGEDLKDLGGAINRWFRRSRDGRPKKEKAAEEAAPDAPPPAVSPTPGGAP